LCAGRKGDIGTVEINRRLQQELNPSDKKKTEITIEGVTLRVGDKVMHNRNNYDIPWRRTDGAGVGNGMFNGDIGTVVSVDHNAQIVSVCFDDKIADYGFDMLWELEPAYAMTVHKSQGSEYRAVVLALLGGSPLLLSRSVLYTAVTRAKELLVIVGSDEAICHMVENNRHERRYSGLKLRLEGDK
jgi:exodeoxyribonuclease V alpha subunit